MLSRCSPLIEHEESSPRLVLGFHLFIILKMLRAKDASVLNTILNRQRNTIRIKCSFSSRSSLIPLKPMNTMLIVTQSFSSEAARLKRGEVRRFWVMMIFGAVNISRNICRLPRWWKIKSLSLACCVRLWISPSHDRNSNLRFKLTSCLEPSALPGALLPLEYY